MSPRGIDTEPPIPATQAPPLGNLPWDWIINQERA
jgi:hypothetical protein